MISETQREVAEQVAEAVEGYCDWTGRIWEGADRGILRVYCRRGEGRKAQDCGHIEVSEDGELEYYLTRNVAGVRRHIEASIGA